MRLAEEASLFGQHVPDQLKVKGAVHTSQMSQIDHDTSTDLQTTACMLQECLQLPADDVTLEACQAVSLLPTCLALPTHWQQFTIVAYSNAMHDCP